MLFSINWIKDFVDLDGIDIDSLIQKFTFSTAEVEEIIHKGGNIDKVVVGQIVSLISHPNSKKLHLLKIDVGSGEAIDCVCGAKNVRLGMKVAFAVAGGRVPSMEIKEVTLAGYTSCGMCCSETELEIGSDNSGIMELPEDAPLGADIKTLYQIDDTLFDVDNKSLTNRPDLWGHYGVAREFAAMTGRKLKSVSVADISKYNDLPEVDVNIDDREHAFRYCSVRAENITRLKSPMNMRLRLHYCGLRPINFLVDLTNYIMLELGQPMHAFDGSKVESVTVRRFEKPFKFTTLDGAERDIDENTLMICEGSDKPSGIAGIMGGLDSEIVNDTSSLLLESAAFDGVCIRKTSSRLGLRTDASMRYEKMLDPELALTAAARYIKLLTDYDTNAKIISRVTDVYVWHYPERKICFEKTLIDKYAGFEISNDFIMATLSSLGFKTKLNDGKFTVDVPSWRATKDVTIPADIVEEIARIYGYDNFKPIAAQSPLFPVSQQKSWLAEREISDLLAVKYALHETHSYIWCDENQMKEIGLSAAENVRILNAHASEESVLRRAMAQSQLVSVNKNKSFASDFGLFEFGRIVDGLDENGKCREKKALGIAIFSRKRSEEALFYALRDIFDAVSFKYTRRNFEFRRTEMPLLDWAHPKNTAEILLDGEKIGYMCVVSPVVAGKIDKKCAIVCGEIICDAIEKAVRSPIMFNEPSKFPAIDIDLTFVASKNVEYSEFKNVISKTSAASLAGISFIGAYPLDEKNLTYTVRLKFSSAERTLTKEDIQPEVEKIITLMDNAGYPMKK